MKESRTHSAIIVQSHYALMKQSTKSRASTRAPLTHRRPRIARLRLRDLPLDTVALAKFLIGKTLVHDLPRIRLTGRIVETEAYLVGDAAAHSFRGITPRNRSLFLERGHAYVYFCYGMHFMLNLSAGPAGTGTGVLIRAVEPLEGIAQMKRTRRTARLLDLARGPGRVAAAFRITGGLDGLNLVSGNGSLWLGTATSTTGPIGESIRIGITKDADRILRFYELDNPFVSGPRRLNVSGGV
jgi:DNA-3-methyladenine glycosylase